MRSVALIGFGVCLTACGVGDGSAPTLSGDAVAGGPGASCEPVRIEPASRIATMSLDGPGVSQRLGVVVVAEDAAQCLDMQGGYRCTFVGPGDVFVIRGEDAHVYRVEAAGRHRLETTDAGVFCVAEPG